VHSLHNNTSVLDGRWIAFRKTARQVLLHTGAEDAPFATSGTYFLVTYEDRLFAVTARHVVGNNPPEKLLLIVSDKTVIPARVLEQIDPSDEIGGGLDLLIYDLDVRHFNTKQRRSCCAYPLLVTEPSWLLWRRTAAYFLFGYPLKYTTMEYGQRTTRTETQQWFCEATYNGESEIAHCHRLLLRDPKRIGDLNGLSGAPVFALVPSRGGDSRPLFAGVVLRGSASSGLVHFLGAEAIRQILDEIRARPRKKLPKRWWGGKTRLRRRPSVHE